MSDYSCAYLAPIVIVEDVNDDVRVEADSAATGTIAAGTYYLLGDEGSNDFIKALANALSVGGGTASVRWGAAASGVRTLEIKIDTGDSSAWSIDCDYSAGGFNAFDWTLLGVTDTSAAFGAADNTYVAIGAMPKDAWISSHSPVSDSRISYEADASQSVAKSGAVWTVQHGGPYEVRTIAHDFEPVQKAFVTTSYDNQSWVAFWGRVNAGAKVWYFPPQTMTAGGYFDDAANGFDCVLDEASCREAKPARYAPGVELYAWTVGLRGYVA